MGVERELSESDVDSDGNEDEAELSRGEKLFKQSDLASCVLQRKAVLRCRMCPKITCLNEEVMKLHLKSKRHTRAEKQMKEGRLKFLLNSDGEIEEEAETHAERHARILASAAAEVKKKNSKGGRQRQKLRKKRKEIKENAVKEKEDTESQPKKKQKTETKEEKEATESQPKKKQKTETKEMKGSKRKAKQAT